MIQHRLGEAAPWKVSSFLDNLWKILDLKTLPNCDQRLSAPIESSKNHSALSARQP